MRRSLLHLILLLAALLMLSAERCASEDELQPDTEQQTRKALDLAEQQLQASTLPDSALRNFEQKVSQKLHDYADYLSFYMDRSVDSTFRETSLELLYELFDSLGTSVSVLTTPDAEPTQIPVDEIPDLASKSRFHAVQLSVDSVEVIQPFRYGQMQAKGKLAFRTTWHFVQDADTLTRTLSSACDISISRVSRDFGDSTLVTWKGLLGKMELH